MSMSTTEVLLKIAEAKRGDPLRVFDWNKAAEIIRDEKPEGVVGAGLAEDWFWTGGTIFAHGRIVVDHCTYLASHWATPVICIDGKYRDCFVMESETDWRCDTKWPQSARDILSALESAS